MSLNRSGNGNGKSVLFIAPQPFYEDRGTPIAVLQHLKVLNELGYEVDLATFPSGTDVEIDGLRIVRTFNPLGFRSVPIGFSFRKILLDFFLMLTVLHLARSKKYHCVHAVEEGAMLALLCKSLFGTPFIYDMHSSLPEQLRNARGLDSGVCRWLVGRFERLLMKGADGIIASKGLAEYVLSVAPSKKVWECFFEGCEPREQDEELASRIRVNNRPTLVYTGNFFPYQDLTLLIEAARAIRQDIPNVALLLVGGGEFDLPRLAELVEEWKLTETVLLCNRVALHEVADYLALADVLVLPRTSGRNAPIKIFDYMKSGKPIVATDIQAHTAVLSDKTAFLVRPEVGSLAEGILRVLRDTEHARNIASEAEREVRSPVHKSLRETLAEAYHYVVNNGNTE